MTVETPGTVLALQAALRERDAYIVRLEGALRDMFGLAQALAEVPLPMVDLIRQLVDQERP